MYENDLPVAASHTLIAELTEEINGFSSKNVEPYDAQYLADWPAETYQITVTDASLAARSRILAKALPHIHIDTTQASKNLQVNAMNMVIESYKLVLVPMWIARYHYEKVWYNVVVNGQTGAVRGEKPRKGVQKWLSGLLSEE